MTTIFELPHLFAPNQGLHIINTGKTYAAHLVSGKREKEPYAKCQSILALMTLLNAGLPATEWLRLSRDGETLVLSYAGQSYRQTEKPKNGGK